MKKKIVGKKKKQCIERDREFGYEQLYCQTSDIWWTIFRRCSLSYARIVILAHCQHRGSVWPVFPTTSRCYRTRWVLSLQKYLHMADQRINSTTTRACQSQSNKNAQRNYVVCVIVACGVEYLRKPNASDCARLVQMDEVKHDFSRMLGNIICIHWAWKNCPTVWACAHHSHKKGCPTIILEVVASTNMWIWYAFYSVVRSNMDINVLNQLPLSATTWMAHRRWSTSQRTTSTTRWDTASIMTFTQSCQLLWRWCCRNRSSKIDSIPPWSISDV